MLRREARGPWDRVLVAGLIMTSLKLAVAVAVVKPTSMYMCIETFLFSATQLAQLYHGSPAKPHFRFIIESIGTVR